MFLENGERRVLPPPQPNLSMKKRTLDALLLQVEQWHQRLGKMKVDVGTRWAPSGIRPASYVRGKDEKRVVWRIHELLSQKELMQEGKALKHCVASYSRQCRNGVSSIWSLTSEDASGNLRRRQTIEVSRHKRIVQCRGRMNKLPSDLEQKIVARWAQAESLSMNLHGY
ncbi:MAG: PcfJ domain-containing protein [Gammaproteobacteria bacterium]